MPGPVKNNLVFSLPPKSNLNWSIFKAGDKNLSLKYSGDPYTGHLNTKKYFNTGQSAV